MPRYEYTCPACEFTLEISHSIHDNTQRPCRVCGYMMVRVIQPTPAHLKGTGWASKSN